MAVGIPPVPRDASQGMALMLNRMREALVDIQATEATATERQLREVRRRGTPGLMGSGQLLRYTEASDASPPPAGHYRLSKLVDGADVAAASWFDTRVSVRLELSATDAAGINRLAYLNRQEHVGTLIGMFRSVRQWVDWEIESVEATGSSVAFGLQHHADSESAMNEYGGAISMLFTLAEIATGTGSNYFLQPVKEISVRGDAGSVGESTVFKPNPAVADFILHLSDGSMKTVRLNVAIDDGGVLAPTLTGTDADDFEIVSP